MTGMLSLTFGQGVEKFSEFRILPLQFFKEPVGSYELVSMH